ncbi:UNVERIFIED_CONTAM: hypothetical protein Sradi_5860700 [Sesamum radiatum]|uniref:Uncharacterized protein n=1 Tax=Sesamum radiatum TaxID=300843 RepID=A0AAW2KR25_SESRA
MAQLEARLQFPIPSFFFEISTLFEIPLNQLVPKAFSILVGFYILVRNLGENPSAQFHSFFMLKKASPGLLYFTSQRDAHFLPSDSSVKEWKSHYFFVSSPIPWAFPTEWISVTPDSLRCSTHTRLATFQTLLERLNSFLYDPRKLIHPTLLFCYGLSPKEVVMDSTAGIILHMNFLFLIYDFLHDVVLTSPYFLQSICSTSSTSTSDPKGKRKSKPLSPPAKKTKVSSTSFAAPRSSTRAGTPCPSVVQIKREKLSSTETSSLLREEAESSRVADFVKGLLAPPNKIFLESLLRDKS